MRNIIKYIFLLAIMQLLLLSCEKEKTILPEREKPVDVAVIKKDYIEKFKSSSTGWMLKYKPENYNDSIYIQLKFQDSTVNILTSYRGYHTEQAGVPYSFEGKYTPIVVFASESIFGELAQLFNGSKKFKITYLENKGVFSLIRSDGFSDDEFFLEKANAQNIGKLNKAIDTVLAQIAYEIEQVRLSKETQLKFTGFFKINSDFYFYNFKTEGFSASIDQLDTLDRTIALTYKASPLSNPTSVKVNYSFYPKGIVLDPAISYNSVVVDTIVLGELNNSTLKIVKAGNAGAGSMGYMHEAPYEIRMIGDRSIGSADWLLSNDFVGSNPAIYTMHSGENYLDDPNYSILTNEYRAVFGKYLETNGINVKATTRLVHQFYLYTDKPNNLQISTHKQSSSGNHFFPYRFTWEKVAGNSSQVKINFYEAYALTAGLEAGFDEYFSKIFPKEGVTVWPVFVETAARIRLISVKDSRIWVEYRITPTPYRVPSFN